MSYKPHKKTSNAGHALLRQPLASVVLLGKAKPSSYSMEGRSTLRLTLVAIAKHLVEFIHFLNAFISQGQDIQNPQTPEGYVQGARFRRARYELLEKLPAQPPFHIPYRNVIRRGPRAHDPSVVAARRGKNKKRSGTKNTSQGHRPRKTTPCPTNNSDEMRAIQDKFDCLQDSMSRIFRYLFDSVADG